MDTIDLEFDFERRKRRILARIEKLKEEWQEIWGKCLDNPQAEALAVQAKLRIQLMETEALDDLKEMQEKIDRAKDYDG
jgi:hypothetical protein